MQGVFLYLQQRPLILLLSGNCRKHDWPRLLPAAANIRHQGATFCTEDRPVLQNNTKKG